MTSLGRGGHSYLPACMAETGAWAVVLLCHAALTSQETSATSVLQGRPLLPTKISRVLKALREGHLFAIL